MTSYHSFKWAKNHLNPLYNGYNTEIASLSRNLADEEEFITTNGYVLGL